SYNNLNNFWIAYKEKGIIQVSKNSSGQFTITKDAINLDGPYMNSPYRMIYDNSRLYMIAGGSNFNGDYLDNPASLMIYQDNEWSFINNRPIVDKYKVGARDYLSIVVDPDDPDNIYASTLGYGLVQIKNMEIENLYNIANGNSPFEAADSGKIERINGLSFDKDKNLWMLNYLGKDAIKILDKNGKWHSKYITSLSEKNYLENLLITSRNQRWIAVPRTSKDVRLVIIDNVDIEDISDNTSVTYTTFIDQDGDLFSPAGYTCLAEDKKGYIWVGTTKGPIYFTNPGNAISNPSNFRCTRLKFIEDNGIPYYFLDNVYITTIAIDGGNRKWIGTAGSGIYVLSEDNEEVIHHFNTSNSPLLSDAIYSIAFDHNSGNVFIGTDEGLVSYLSEAVAPKEDFSNVYAFPNPVNPDYNGLVTITGLMDNTNIKITDLNGNLIYQTKSIGGQATWNCRNRSGNKVATGVYLVFGATENGSESVVTKIVVVK
ncbi:MAG: T9SS type A sorting domain-containing protein, partial [Tannerellaceae bacterium]|nr:T9SS type A sorting domain-containing protein [Tannerellaceae bacterium]